MGTSHERLTFNLWNAHVWHVLWAGAAWQVWAGHRTRSSLVSSGAFCLTSGSGGCVFAFNAIPILLLLSSFFLSGYRLSIDSKDLLILLLPLVLKCNVNSQWKNNGRLLDLILGCWNLIYLEKQGFCGMFSSPVVYNSYCCAQVFYLFLIYEANALLFSYADGLVTDAFRTSAVFCLIIFILEGTALLSCMSRVQFCTVSCCAWRTSYYMGMDSSFLERKVPCLLQLRPGWYSSDWSEKWENDR